MRPIRYHLKVVLILAVFTGQASFAVDKEWNLAANGTWNTAVNWSPNGVPAAGDLVFLGRAPFPQGFLTTLDIDATVAGLTMRNGSDFATGGFQLLVNGLTTVAGSGSVFSVDSRSTGDLDSLDTEGLLIDNSGLVSMRGGIIEIESGALDILAGGVVGSGGLSGNGTIELVQTGLAGAQAFNNSGGIAVTRAVLGIGGTLTITNTDTDNPATVGDGTVDLDGDSEAGVVDVDDNPFGLVSNLTLVIDAALADAFSGEMLIGKGDTVDMRRAWSLNGDLQLNGDTGTATLRGSALTLLTGANLNVNSGTGNIVNNLTLLGGTINVASGTTLKLDGTTTINDVSGLQLIGTATLHVTGSTNITEATGDFDWGNGAVTRVSGSGLLTIDVDHINLGNDSFSSEIQLDDDGDLSVTVTDGAWELVAGGELNKNNAGVSSVSGSRLEVNSGVINVNAGTLEIHPELDLGFGASVVVDTGATAQFDGATEFAPGSLTLINGTLDLNGATTWNAPALVSGSGTIINDGGSTFLGNTTINVATLDWDQGSTDVEAGASLTLNVDNIDVGNDTVNNATIAVKSGQLTVNVADDAWALGNGAILRLNNTNGTEPALHGDRVVVTAGGVIQVRNGDADISAPVTIETGSQILIETPLTLQLQGPTTLAGGTINEAAGVNATLGQFGPLTVTGSSSINVDTYNWDQAATTVESGGSLTLNVTALDQQAGERYDNNLILNSGTLTVNNTLGEWTVDQFVELNNSTGAVPRISGSDLLVGDGVGSLDADLRARGTGVSELNTRVTYRSDADVSATSDATLRHLNTVTFSGGGSYTGAGTLDFASVVNVTGATSIDMPNGTVDLDGPNTDLLGNTLTVNAPWTINAATLAPFGKNNLAGTNLMGVNSTMGGSLTVNLTDPASSWQVTSNGQLTLLSGAAPTTVLAGSDLDMDGLLTISGDVRTTARLLIGGTTNIITPGESLRLEGGTLANPNRLEGGAINGPGSLVSSAGRALHGFGTVAANVDFAGSAELKARDGLLSVTGTVLDVGEIGTASTSGILNMSNPWNTNVANQVRMAGGEIRGAVITNDGVNGIRGHGQLTAQIVNNTKIFADGGTLVVNNVNSDYDGAAGTGGLDATSGNLEIRDNATFGFTGGAVVGSGRNVQVNGFRMNLSPGSTLQMTGGSWQTTTGMNLAGTLTVNAGSPALIEAVSDLTFVSGSSTTLGSDLWINANPAVVQVGATFTGGGDLVATGAAELRLNNGAVLGVGIRNEALLTLGTAAARADAADFVQTALGTIAIDVAGTGINQFDRLVLTGAAQLNGELAVSLGGGFVPSLGNSFSILTAPGGVLGTFQTETLPTLAAGLSFDVIYNPTSVVLQVIQSLTPDFDMDGDVDGMDVDLLVMEIVGMTNGTLFDLTGDGLVNNGDLTEWLDQAGAINLASGNSYLYGDANLDGVVDGSDFGIWNSNKFTLNARWTAADFNADGAIDGSDFGIWNSNKFTSADAARAMVPEPTGGLAWLVAIAIAGIGGYRARNRS